MDNHKFFDSFRPPELEDAARVLELMVMCDLQEYGETDSDEVDLLHGWGQIDLSRDAWMAFDVSGQLAGYAAVLPMGSGDRYEFFVHPQIMNPAADVILIEHCIERTRQRLNTAEPRRSATTFVAAVNQRDRDAVERTGFQVKRNHFQMRKDLAESPPAAVLPESVRLRAFDPASPSETGAVFNLVQAAFSKPGRQPQRYDDWVESMQREDIFDPGLWFMAVSGQDVIGVSLCFEYPGLGWVRQLAVAEQWRRRGLGAALLQHSFLEFWKRGFTAVGLGVSADNTNALAFYLQLGMFIKRQYCEYENWIPR